MPHDDLYLRRLKVLQQQRKPGNDKEGPKRLVDCPYVPPPPPPFSPPSPEPIEEGPRRLKVERPTPEKDLVRRMRRVDPNQARRYRQRDGGVN
ncbi:MAG: ubiquitin-like protein UBact [Candidatus Latescibacteria bacterium]|nr:ubiquitin-like protein UBact [Candidatus Latescibacterota bacterium]